MNKPSEFVLSNQATVSLRKRDIVALLIVFSLLYVCSCFIDQDKNSKDPDEMQHNAAFQLCLH